MPRGTKTTDDKPHRHDQAKKQQRGKTDDKNITRKEFYFEYLEHGAD